MATLREATDYDKWYNSGELKVDYDKPDDPYDTGMTITDTRIPDQQPLLEGYQSESRQRGPESDEPPVYMTNIPGDEDIANQPEGTEIMDISEPPPKPPPWVGTDKDLSDPAEKEKFLQSYRKTNSGGINWGEMNIYEEAADKHDPSLYPKEFKSTLGQLKAQRKSAMDAEKVISDKYDEFANQQDAYKKRQAAQSKDLRKEAAAGNKRFLEIGKNNIALQKQYAGIDKQAADYPNDEMVQDTIRLQKEEITTQMNANKTRMQELKDKFQIGLEMPTEAAAAHRPGSTVAPKQDLSQYDTSEKTKAGIQSGAIKRGPEAKRHIESLMSAQNKAKVAPKTVKPKPKNIDKGIEKKVKKAITSKSVPGRLTANSIAKNISSSLTQAERAKLLRDWEYTKGWLKDLTGFVFKKRDISLTPKFGDKPPK